jgi:hypothetical protein
MQATPASHPAAKKCTLAESSSLEHTAHSLDELSDREKHRVGSLALQRPNSAAIPTPPHKATLVDDSQLARACPFVRRRETLDRPPWVRHTARIDDVRDEMH